MNEKTLRKLRILAESAKYDASCASSGSTRRNRGADGVGNAARYGICHSFTDDGRCVSLVKILFSNYCAYDCAYCVNRRGNDLPRTAFSPHELSELVIEFYRRNYIEGLFLSSALMSSPDNTMERMVRALRDLRVRHRFNGYIHLKILPGCSPDLVRQAGFLADRLSVNIEIPSEASLRFLAPQKSYSTIYQPMRCITDGVRENREDRRKYRSTPEFTPAGQSTQMIIGAGNEPDRDILLLSSMLYSGPKLERVYYSGFIPVNKHDSRLPALTQPPLLREHRLYQADWLMRLYGFQAEEILEPTQPHLDLLIDPKLAWALRHPHLFPLDVNKADYLEILRVPGVGRLSARRILVARRHRRLGLDELVTLGVTMKRAKWFLTSPYSSRHAPVATIQEAGPEAVRNALAPASVRSESYQLSLFHDTRDC